MNMVFHELFSSGGAEICFRPVSQYTLADSSAAFGAVDPLTIRLREEWQIEVPVFPWRDWPGRLLRISAHLYNEMADYERLADALCEELS